MCRCVCTFTFITWKRLRFVLTFLLISVYVPWHKGDSVKYEYEFSKQFFFVSTHKYTENFSESWTIRRGYNIVAILIAAEIYWAQQKMFLKRNQKDTKSNKSQKQISFSDASGFVIQFTFFLLFLIIFH